MPGTALNYLPQQRERVTVDGLGNIGQGKYTGGSDRPAMKQRVGSKITGTVSDQERAELLEHPRTVLTSGVQQGGYYGSGSGGFSPKSLDISGESGIIRSEEKSSKKLAGVHRGDPMSFKEADSGAPNPLFERGGGYFRNCQASLAAYDARRRGYNVKALPFTGTRAFKQLAQKPQSAWIDPVTSQAPSTVFSEPPKSLLKLLSSLTRRVEQGQRFELTFYYRNFGRGGHVVSVEKDSRGLFIYDAQSGDIYRGLRLLKYASSIDYQRDIQLFRVDNAELNTALLNQVLGGA